MNISDVRAYSSLLHLAIICPIFQVDSVSFHIITAINPTNERATSTCMLSNPPPAVKRADVGSLRLMAVLVSLPLSHTLCRHIKSAGF